MIRGHALRGLVAGLVGLWSGGGLAADLPTRIPYKAPPPPPVFSWTGFYVGAHLGSSWITKDQSTRFTTPGVTLTAANSTQSLTGFLGGAQVGFNYQVAQWVLGIEAQFSWTSQDTTTSCAVGILLTDPQFNKCRTKVDRLGTVAGRLGWAVDRALIFVKGGGAFVRDNYNYSTGLGAPPLLLDNISDTRWGWMWGGGLEYALDANWSAKLEYDFLDFGTKTYALPVMDALFQPTNTQEIRQRVSLIKFGVNYRFGFGPVVANY